MKELPTGIRETPTGYQTYVWVKDPTRTRGGYQASKRWPKTASLAEMKQWRPKRKYAHPETVSPDATTFSEDVRDYTFRDKVQRMPTCDERCRHMDEWVAIFGHRARATIQPHEIQKALDRMRGHLSAGSVNKRRTALMDLWTTLDGKHQANPVKGTRAYEEPTPEPRAPAFLTVLQIIDAMPTKTDYGKKCKARLQVLAWTGWPHKIIKQLEPSDLEHWKRGEAFVKRRKKGKGARARWLPLLPEAVHALLEFHKADAYGYFSNSSLHTRVAATCDRLELPHLRPYDLRHFFLTLVAITTRDERAVMELGMISTLKTARRYTEAATDPRVNAALQQVAGHVAARLAELAESRRVSLSPNVSE